MPYRKHAGRKAAGRTGGGVSALARNPALGVSGAALLFLGLAAALVVMTGDPAAGAPSLRLPLTKIGAVENMPAGWREALAHEPEGDAQLAQETITLSNGPAAAHEAKSQSAHGAPAAHAEPAALRVGAPLPQAPIAGMHAPGPGGAPLPIVAADGRAPAQAYARPFVASGAPKVALVVGGLGMNAQVTRTAIESLPPEITLAFAPYAPGLQEWIDLARAAGHEVLLEAPMEPADYPNNDPGPYTLLVDNRPDETVTKLEWLLSRAVGYFGVSNYLGSRFLGSDPAMATFNGALTRRGVAFIDNGAGRQRSGPLRASADRIVDEQLSAEAIGRQLGVLEATAFSRGQALGTGFAYPVTIREVVRWARGLPERGLQLAPASALLSKGGGAAPAHAPVRTASAH